MEDENRQAMTIEHGIACATRQVGAAPYTACNCGVAEAAQQLLDEQHRHAMTSEVDRPDVQLVAFCDGSYKKVRPVQWKQSQWIHYTLADGSVVMINPANVNYIHRGLAE